jgi:hypothetical protein
MEFGQYIILPFILGKEEKDLWAFVAAIVGEIPSIALALLIVDLKFLGRQRGLYISFLIIAGANCGVYFSGVSYLGF